METLVCGSGHLCLFAVFCLQILACSKRCKLITDSDEFSGGLGHGTGSK